MTTKCGGCHSEKDDVIKRDVGNSIVELCADCADRRRAITGQTYGSTPPDALPRRSGGGGND